MAEASPATAATADSARQRRQRLQRRQGRRRRVHRQWRRRRRCCGIQRPHQLENSDIGDQHAGGAGGNAGLIGWGGAGGKGSDVSTITITPRAEMAARAVEVARYSAAAAPVALAEMRYYHRGYHHDVTPVTFELLGRHFNENHNNQPSGNTLGFQAAKAALRRRAADRRRRSGVAAAAPRFRHQGRRRSGLAGGAAGTSSWRRRGGERGPAEHRNARAQPTRLRFQPCGPSIRITSYRTRCISRRLQEGPRRAVQACRRHERPLWQRRRRRRRR